MKIRIYLFAAAMALFSLSVNVRAGIQSDSGIRGVAANSADGSGIAYVTVALLAQDSTIVSAGTSGEDGSFLLSAAQGNYILKLALLGYKDVDMNISVPAEGLDLGKITMQEDSQMIEAARLSEKMPVMETKIDKIVMNVSQSAFAQTSNGLDILKRSPGVTIDKDGNVKLNGKSVAIWIDGRPSHLDGKALESLLKSTSGSTLDKIEIMEHPSAKYDAEGQGGIINIKTKKNVKDGINGSVHASGGGMYFNDYDFWNTESELGLNLAYRSKKNNTFLNISSDTQQLKQLENVEMTSGSYTKFSESLLGVNYAGTNIKFGNDWFINDKNTLGFIVSLPFTRMKLSSEPTNTFSFISIDNIITKSDISELDSPSRYNQQSYNVNYTHIFDPAKSSEITFNADWFTNNSDSKSKTSSWDKESGDPTSLRYNSSLQTVDIWSAKADYQTVMFGKAMFEAGTKWSHSDTDSDISREMADYPESAIKNDSKFEYKEDIAALYATIAAQLSQKWSIKAGLRGEYTHSLGKTSTMGDISRSYFNLFPTVFVGYNPSQNWMLSTSYTRRISRPGYSQLDPVEVFIDAGNSIVGNPDLQPQNTDGLDMSASYKQYLSMNLGYSHTSDLQTQMPESKDGRLVMTWDNSGRWSIVYAALNVSSLPVTKWLSWTMSARAYYMSSADISGNVIDAPGFGGYTCLTFDLPKDWKIELEGNGMTKIAWGTMLMMPTFNSDLGVRKILLDGKMTLSADISDLFRTMYQDIRLTMPGFDKASITEQHYRQTMTVGLSWNFGKAQQTRRRNVGNLEEASRTGSSSSIGK